MSTAAPQIKEKVKSEIVQKQFSAYLLTTLRGNQIDYTRRMAKRFSQESIYEDLEEVELKELADKRPYQNDPFSLLTARPPKNWTELLAVLDDQTLRFYLGNLSPKEGELLFDYLVKGIPFKTMDELNPTGMNSETRFATILRKLRRWIAGGK